MNEQAILTDLKRELEKSVDAVAEDLLTIRTGRATPALVEKLMVTTYGGQSRLKLMELATITLEGPSGLLIRPFDPSTIQDIERAILESPINLTPQTVETSIHIKVPPLSQEQRTQLMRLISQKIEEGRVRLRALRDEIRRRIKSAFEAKELSEDEKFRIEKEIDRVVREFTDSLEQRKQKKEKEIMEV